MTEARFHTTRWSLVARAGDAREELRRDALEELCRAYWYPLYAFLRRDGRGPDAAADLVQGLFASLLERDSLARLSSEGGRFRSWLLAALVHHAKDERAREQALKRGGAARHVPLDRQAAETRYRVELADPRPAADLFQRAWALAVLERALARLRAESAARGKGALFEALAGFLRAGEHQPRAAEVGPRLGLSPVAVRVAAHRLRGRYRELLVDEVRETLGDDLDPGEELRELLAALEG